MPHSSRVIHRYWHLLNVRYGSIMDTAMSSMTQNDVERLEMFATVSLQAFLKKSRDSEALHKRPAREGKMWKER